MSVLMRTDESRRLDEGSDTDTAFPQFFICYIYIHWRCDSGWWIKSWWLCQRRRPSLLLWRPLTLSVGQSEKREGSLQVFFLTWQMRQKTTLGWKWIHELSIIALSRQMFLLTYWLIHFFIQHSLTQVSLNLFKMNKKKLTKKKLQ